MDTSTKLTTELAVDTPAELSAALRTEADDRRKIDNQILAIQRFLVTSAMRGIGDTWCYLAGTSAAVTQKDCVTPAALADIDGIPVVTKAVAAALTNGVSVSGIVRAGASPGGLVRIAKTGQLSTTDTGLIAGSPGPVRCNTTTARCEHVGAIGVSDYPVGTVDNYGNLTIGGLPVGGGGSGGGGGLWVEDHAITDISIGSAFPTVTTLATVTITGTDLIIHATIGGAGVGTGTLIGKLTVDGVTKFYQYSQFSNGNGVGLTLIGRVSGLANTAHTVVFAAGGSGGSVTVNAVTDPLSSARLLVNAIG